MMKPVDTKGSIRVSATLPSNHYEALVSLAEKKKVSLAWLVRHAVERLLEETDGGPRLPFDP